MSIKIKQDSQYTNNTSTKNLASELFKYEDLPPYYAEIAHVKLKRSVYENLINMGFSDEEITSTEKYRTSMLDYELSKSIEKSFFAYSDGFYYLVVLDKLKL